MPIETNEANVVGTLTLLEVCRQKGVERVVYAASSSAYGDHDAAVKTETLEPRPKSPYAVQKLTGSIIAQSITSCLASRPSRSATSTFLGVDRILKANTRQWYPLL